MSRIPVAILGATGAVGQKFVRLLADHPWFEIAQLSASAERVGKRYGDEVRWRELTPLPDHIADIKMTAMTPVDGVKMAFSGVDAAIAREVEPAFAHAGVLVVTNASAFRMESDVPLLIPEVNANHIQVIEQQRRNRGWTGGIIANPNCCVAAFAMGLAPLDRAFGLQSAIVATLQATSGAGYPGVPSLDILGNIIPYIGGNEEEKIAAETKKILGTLSSEGIRSSTFGVSAMVHRVPVLDGHLLSASIRFLGAPPTPEAANALLGEFTGEESARGLPSSPARPIEVESRIDRPQSRLDIDRGNGMTVTVGRMRPCEVQHLRLVLLGHNLIRGAAGAAVLNGELAVQQGLLER